MKRAAIVLAIIVGVVAAGLAVWQWRERVAADAVAEHRERELRALKDSAADLTRQVGELAELADEKDVEIETTRAELERVQRRERQALEEANRREREAVVAAAAAGASVRETLETVRELAPPELRELADSAVVQHDEFAAQSYSVAAHLREQLRAASALYVVADSIAEAERSGRLAERLARQAAERNIEQLTRALTGQEGETEYWKNRANPGILTRLKRAAPLVGGTVAVTLLLVSLN